MTTPHPASTPTSLPRRIASGEWAVTLDGCSIDDVTWRGTVVLRGLRFVVRDEDWRTPAAVLDSVDLDEAPQGFRLVVRAHIADLGVGTAWEAVVTASDSGLRYEVAGRATIAFRRNRLGVVVLHGPELAGVGVEVGHPAQASTRTVFPPDIAPHQPAQDIASLAWSHDGVDAQLDFEGDVFEMEDQRNWTDASFKTYSTPLSLPFPVDVAPGDAFAQAVSLSVSASAPPPLGRPRPEPVSAGCTAPSMTVGASTSPGTALPQPSWMRGLPVLVELDATGPAWSRVLARARNDSAGGSLDVRIVAARPEELDAVVHALCGIQVLRLAVYDAATHVTTPALHDRLMALAASEPLTGELVGGTRAHFTELNRNHAALPPELGALTFSLTPQMHDDSSRQVLDSLGMQRLVATNVVRIGAGRPVHVGPVTLRARFNAVATSPRPVDDPDVARLGYGAEQVWNSTDPGQTSAGYAAWLLASYRALAVPGVASIAFAEAWGPRGFGTAAGEAFPAAEVLGRLAALAGSTLLETPFDPLLPVVVARRGATTTVLAANLHDSPRTVSAAGLTETLAPLAHLHRVAVDA